MAEKLVSITWLHKAGLITPESSFRLASKNTLSLLAVTTGRPSKLPISGCILYMWLLTGVCVGSVCSNHHGNLHGVTVGVGQVTEDEQRSLLSQRLSHGEVPQLRADVLHGGALWATQRQDRLASAPPLRNNPLLTLSPFLVQPIRTPRPAGETEAHVLDPYLVRGTHSFPFIKLYSDLPRGAN